MERWAARDSPATIAAAERSLNLKRPLSGLATAPSHVPINLQLLLQLAAVDSASRQLVAVDSASQPLVADVPVAHATKAASAIQQAEAAGMAAASWAD